MRSPIDLDPLTSCPAFRRLWIGTSATSIGSGIGTYAVMLHVWNHTNDARVLGAVGLIRALPLIAFAIVGGTFSDSRSRRFVALVAACGQSGAALLLAGIALIGKVLNDERQLARKTRVRTAVSATPTPMARHHDYPTPSLVPNLASW